MNIQLDKKYTTRDSREVIIHAIDGPEERNPVIASVKNQDGWVVCRYPKDGTNCLYRDAELIEFEPLKEIIFSKPGFDPEIGFKLEVTHKQQHPVLPESVMITLTEVK